LRGNGKSTQRERLLSAMTDVAAEDGYAGATIARVILRAGVSRASFYEHFAEKDDCFLAALERAQGHVLAEVARSVRGNPPQHAAQAAVQALVAFADSHLAMARLLTGEALAGGARALEARDRSLGELARIVQHAHADVDAAAISPDLPVETLLGAVQRLLAAGLRGHERLPAGALERLLQWIRGYERPTGEHRFRTLAPVAPSARSPFLPLSALHAPPALPPGRPRLSERHVAENQRQRILFATAEVIARDGYAQATVAEIAKLARVDGRVFYRLFADKLDAFMAVHELAFQHTMAVTAGAFFATESWPGRVWEAARAFVQFIEQNPLLTHASLIEGHAGGPLSARRVEDLATAFTLFLQEGYRVSSPHTSPSHLALEAIAATNFEIVYRGARGGATGARPSCSPASIAHICLAPFLGSQAAERLIDQRSGLA
jgi:AcrR family transcriptional regulator